MEETIDAFRFIRKHKTHQPDLRKQLRYLNVWLDKDKMDSILKNIISNALKYTPDGGNVHVFTSETEDTWSIEVKDTGIGIPTCEQKKLFRNYFRGSNVVNLKVTGSGIGLMLVYKLVKLHKGKIQIQSAENQGTCVRITFPKGIAISIKQNLSLPKHRMNVWRLL
mgnify:CR=1 FL=1